MIMARLNLSLLSMVCLAAWLMSPVTASGGNAAPAASLPSNIPLPDPKGSEALGWTMLVIGGLVGIVGTGAGVTLTVITVVEKIRGRKATEIAQPLRVSKAEAWVREEDIIHLRAEINARFGQVDREVGDIKASLKEQMKRMEDYQHAMRHEMKDEMQAIRLAGEEHKASIHEDLTSSQRSYHQAVGKVHARCDEMVEKIGKLMGQVEIAVSAVTKK